MARQEGKVHQVSEAELKRKLESDERRGQTRFDARLQVDVPLASWDEVRSVYTTNISKGGLLFTMAPPASMPASVELTLTLPDGNKLTLEAEVRHVARREGTPEFDVGVQFQDLDAATRAAFEAALTRLA